MKLTIELIPSSSWFTNVRSAVSKSEWDNIRKQVYKKADYKCEICDKKGKSHPVECHEIFEFDDQKLLQTLTNMVALCPDCHMVKHIGLAEVQGKFDKAIKHFIKINKVSKAEANSYIQDCFAIWAQRSKKKWKVDVSLLSNYGINYK
jgi:5-methylcytosine-specific restriction endonuclease McrA